MGGINNPSGALFALVYSLLLASLPLIDAQIVGEYSVTNLRASWDDIPEFYSSADGKFILKPILIRTNPGVGFVSGFWCSVFFRNCLFSILIFPSADYLQPSDRGLVWSANRNKPVRYNATLRFTEHGDLILADDDGSLVWSTKTGGKSVSGLNLTEEGNLVLFDRDNKRVWQSFDHPTDTLLLGQNLALGNKLIANVSSSNWSEGTFTLDAQRDALYAYTDLNPLRYYYGSLLNWSTTPHLRFQNGSFNELSIPPASSPAQFMKLEPDGHLRVYQWVVGDDTDWNEVADLLTPAVGDCGYPFSCGKYGICSNGQCSCPPGEAKNGTSLFRQENSRQPNQGCSPITPISCNYSKYQSLLELQNTSYSNSYRFVYEEKELEDCKKACLHNCSCKAFLFQYESALSCLLLSDVLTLVIREADMFYNISTFLKVQSNPTVVPESPDQKIADILRKSGIGALLGVVLIAVSFLLFRYGKRMESKELEEINLDLVPGMPSRFSYEDLKTMTNNFNIKLGQGGFGSVFEGTLSSGTKVAVKRLDGLGQVKNSFLAEVETIGSIHHFNLVRLIGFCAEKTFRLLVYEYMPNGSLDKWIFCKSNELTLGWQSRRKIISDIAKGLAYLHEDCRQKIIHLDIKSQNILLDENLNAKVSDFGLSKLVDKDQSQVVTTLRGTPGYLAPEWLNSIITEKVDVYSFGVVVLEILCGRKNLDRSQPEEDMHLLALFKRKAEEGRLPDIIDKHHDEMQQHEAEVVEMMKIAAWCLQSDFVKRPPMSVVVKVLEGLVDVETNLDYNFTNLAIPRKVGAAGLNEDVVHAATMLSSSTLSGPR
ncbi:G-type lectin S-receptor-like serine/threonine-protein kinase SD2-5 isoform X2 [Rhododendron vialii]|uniref:G-type lectin S-receptor-like serine/threonine-protein kinase SD2-5 isoform X2 n=1 Tax=Rhododendron vialii TaxID=182163 RepID=UPI00265E5341|nr:G-type lectin S-receptor-like serine/threonine-protein kinase SD2-5 isoform X2 [Rhododendron vialii]